MHKSYKKPTYICLIDGQIVKQAKCFKYLGCLTTEDGYCEKETECTTEMAKRLFLDRKKLS